MPAFKDMLSEADRKKVEGWAVRAKSPKHETDIPPELYQLAEHAYYFGFEAVEAVMRGHIIDINEEGKVSHIPYTFETMVGLNQAARKVRYRQIVDSADIEAAATAGVMGGNRDFANKLVRKSNSIRKEL